MSKTKTLPTGIDLKQLRQYISKHYGGRCKTYLWDCPDCIAWI
jgi:lipopolysaccharide biosynthesis regulator YciM